MLAASFAERIIILCAVRIANHCAFCCLSNRQICTAYSFSAVCIDETYINVKGQLVYLYRAIDSDGNIVDTLLSATRGKKVATRFFQQAQQATGVKPTSMTTEKLASCRNCTQRYRSGA